MSVSTISPSESPSPPPQFLSSEGSPSPPTPSQKRFKNGHRVRIAEEPSPTETSLDNSGAVFWNASLLYYTGVASPKIKQHHLRNSLSMSDMHRPRSPAGSKSLTKSPSKDSGTGTYSSAATVNSSNGEERMSPLRRRHLSCGSSSTISTNSSSMGSLKDRIKNSSGSMRVMKAISRRPSLSSFMEKTQSLGRYNRKKSGSPDDNVDGETEGGQTSSEATTTSSGLSSTAKVFRDSFRAARNMFEASSSSSSKQQKLPASKAKKEVLPSSTSHSDTNGSASTINYSEPNTPKIIKSRSSSSVDISQTKGVVAKDYTLTASTDDITSVESFSKGATKESSNKSSITAPSSSKTGSLDGSKESSKSSKFKKSKDKDKEPEKAGTPKKVSLVKSITNKIRSRSKDSKEKDLSAEIKVTTDRRSPPEIVQLENEPRVRTPKALRHRIKSPWQEKDREYNEMEVSEESLAISRAEKVPHEVTDETTSSSQNENVTMSQNVSQAESQQQKSQDDPISKKDKGKKGKSSKKDSKVNQSTSSASSASMTMTTTPNVTTTPKPDPVDTVDSSSSSQKVKPPKDKKTKSKAIKSAEGLLDTKLDLDEDVIKSKKTEEAIIASSKSLVLDVQKQAPIETGKGKSRGVNLVKQTEPDTNRSGGHAASSVVQDANKDVTQDNPNVDEDDDNAGAKEDLEEGEEPSCTESFRQLKPFNFDLEPIEEGKRERLYKVLVVGELGSGKTSIIKRYVHQFFSQHYRATIGVDFALKVLRWDPDTVVRLQLWDIAGQERFGSMTRVYYKEAVGAFVVFDVTRAATLEAVPKWKADLDSKVTLPDGRPIPTVLLANKSDQPKEGIAANREKMNEFCQQQGFSAWFETSAKDNINIDESANFLVSKILEMDRWSQEPLAPDPDKVDLSANGKHKPSSSSNCAC